MKKGKLYISFLLGLCLCLFAAFGLTACEDEKPAPTLSTISVSGETEVFIDDFDYADYTITATYSDESTKTATLTADNLSAEDSAKLSTVGTHTLTVNYESVSCSWTVTLKNHDFTGVTFADVTTTYDGTAKTLAVAGLPTGAEVSYDKATSYTDAGEYTVKATVTLANYNPLELTATLTINKATYDMSAVVFADKTVTYDGQTHSILATNLPNGVTVQYTNNNQKNAGGYTVTATFTGDSQNYEPIANKTATLTIEKREIMLNFMGNTTVVYTGVAQQPLSVRAVNLVVGDSVELTIRYSGEMIEAGDYIATATIAEHQNYQLTANNTVNVKITRAAHTVTFKQDGFADVTRTVLDLAALTDIPEPKKVDGYEIVWNKTSFECVTGDVLVETVNTPITYEIVYELGGGVNHDSNPESYTVESASITLQEPKKTGYAFKGWFPDEGLETPITTIAKGSYGDLTVYADWEIITYTITYELDGGENHDDNPEEYTVESASITLQEPKKTGYTFKGWFTDEGLEKPITTIAKGSYGDLTVYADWEIITYTITYKLDGGKNHYNNPGEYTVESASITLQEPKKTGYSFKGWFTDEGLKTPITTIVKGSYGNLTVYADWEIITYTITYELDGGVNHDDNPEAYTIESASITLQEPKKTGYAFKGWFTDEGLETPITTIAKGSYGELTVYADWEIITYTITYELDGGKNHDDNPETITVLDLPVILKKPSKKDYTFDGWYLDEAYQQPVQTLSESKSYNVYAKWIEGTEGLVYELSNGEYTVMYYAGTDTDVVIPSAYNGCAVTSIRLLAFSDRSDLKSVTIGNSVTSIGDDAFSGCSSLTSITIPDSVTSIGYGAFWGCSSLKSATIGNGVMSIGSWAFYECSGLTSITIGGGVTSIGEHAFDSCSGLTSITIPDSVKNIGNYAFGWCSSLTSVYYKGTAEQWTAITLDDGNTDLKNATRYYYSESEPALNSDGTAYDGNYWHYGENNEIVVWVYTKPEE